MDNRFMIRKHKYLSCINIITRMFSTFFELIIILMLIVSFIVQANPVFIEQIVFIGLCVLIFQFVIMTSINFIFSRYGHHKILINANYIEDINHRYSINHARIVYSPLVLSNFLLGQPGELIMIVSHEKVFLGWFTSREIIKMMKFAHIIVEKYK